MIPYRDLCELEQHSHCKLYNFPEQKIFHLCAEQQLDLVDYFSNAEVLHFIKVKLNMQN